MALLRRNRDGRWVNLGARTLVGRYPQCELRLVDRRVSGHHATFLFDLGRWWVRAQETTNGTFVDGFRVPGGHRHPLDVDAVVQLGPLSQTWRVVRLDPPSVAVIEDDGSPEVLRTNEWSTPDGRIRLIEADGEWFVEGPSERHPIANGDRIESEGRGWTVQLPTTWRGGSSHTQPLDGEAVRLTLEASADGDRVYRCVLQVGSSRHVVKVRRHMHLLLELAEAQQRHRKPDDGWVAATVLVRRLGVSPNQLHVYTHRAASQLHDAGLPEGRVLIETRGERGNRQLRLGVAARIAHLG